MTEKRTLADEIDWRLDEYAHGAVRKLVPRVRALEAENEKLRANAQAQDEENDDSYSEMYGRAVSAEAERDRLREERAEILTAVRWASGGVRSGLDRLEDVLETSLRVEPIDLRQALAPDPTATDTNAEDDR